MVEHSIGRHLEITVWRNGVFTSSPSPRAHRRLIAFTIAAMSAGPIRQQPPTTRAPSPIQTWTGRAGQPVRAPAGKPPDPATLKATQLGHGPALVTPVLRAVAQHRAIRTYRAGHPARTGSAGEFDTAPQQHLRLVAEAL